MTSQETTKLTLQKSHDDLPQRNKHYQRSKSPQEDTRAFQFPKVIMTLVACGTFKERIPKDINVTSSLSIQNGMCPTRKDEYDAIPHTEKNRQMFVGNCSGQP